MPLYRKKPVVIRAEQWNPGDDSNNEALLDILSNHAGWHMVDEGICLPTLEGDMTANPGDWIIEGVQGEVYPCKPDIFEETYEYVAPEPPLDGTDD